MKIISDTTPIISLASVGRLDILKKLFGEVFIPEAVYNEIKAKKSHGDRETDSEYIKTRTVAGKMYGNLLLSQLDAGEAEVILLAKEMNADFVIIDENLGYRIAKNSGLDVVRTLSVILKAKQEGIINEAKPLLDEMIVKGIWYSARVYETFLKKAGEL